ncbi:MAG: ATP-binding cassette domain-containing protein, partial [Mesorhizobium sp.]
MPLLEIEGVSKAFGSLKAVDDVSFAVEAGEIFGVAGPNGSGKSTLFNVITGIP